MIRRLLNLLLAALLMMAGPAAAWAEAVPAEPSCCGATCPCPPPPRPTPPPQVPATRTLGVAVVQTRTEAERTPRAPEPRPWPASLDGVAEPPADVRVTPSDFDPPKPSKRQSLLGVFRK